MRYIFTMKTPNPQSEIRGSTKLTAGNPQLPRWLCTLLLPLILSAAAMASDAPNPDAVNVFSCTFGDEWDVNYDGWPDRWVRKTGLEYPHYVQIQIDDDKSAPSKKCLTLKLDGAAAAISSPPIRVMPRFSYVFQAHLKNEKLVHSTVVLTLDFCDATGRVLQSKRSNPYAATKGWQLVELEQLEPCDPAIDRVVLGLQVLRTNKGDLHGRVSLADVRVSRLPRIDVSTNNPSNVYTSLDDVVVRCELSGIPERDPEIRFQLLDAHDNVLQTAEQRLDGQLIVDAKQTGDAVESGAPTPDGYEGTSEWRPNIPDYGYYRVEVRMLSAQTGENADAKRELASPRTIYLAVAPPLPMPRQGEFGWTLPGGDKPLSFQELSRLLPQVGVSWVKLPVWFDANDRARADELIRFVELLGASNVDAIGVIDRPPPTSEIAGRSSRDVPIAELLSSDSSAWAASLEPVMTRLSLRVRWWQLGRECDTSFVGITGLNKRIEEIRTALFRFGQDVRMGISCDWANTTGVTGPVSWYFQQLCTEAPLTEDQFAEMLARPRENTALHWVTVDPPPRIVDPEQSSESLLYARCSELVRRMVLAKMHGADAVFVTDPFNDDRGLMRTSGMPAELLLPWRTTAAMISGGKYLGEMRLPGGSHNRIFARPDGQVVMVVWNETPAEETLYLGEDVRQYDIFGRSTRLAKDENQQTIKVDVTPSFVLGLHEGITRWRMSVAFEKDAVPSVFAKPHPNSLRFKNYFPQGVGGSFKIVVDSPKPTEEESHPEQPAAEAAGFSIERWMIEPPQAAFQLSSEEETIFPFEIELRNALYGRQPVRIDFKVEADQEYEFSVYTEMQVGTDDLTLDVFSHLDDDGTLIVEQLMTNSADQPADFKCFLRAKGHRRQRTQIYRLGKEVARKVYRFPNGADLVGKEMLLEIEELNGPRELRYRFIATEESPESAQVNPEDAETAGSSKPDATAAEHAEPTGARS
jgi:hypothetical protein